MKKNLIGILVLAGLQACASSPEKQTVRICDQQGCSDRPRSESTFVPEAALSPEEKLKIAQLTELADKDARAAFDLGLRYFRGDGVTRNTYQALMWMRKAGERGNAEAQLAVGRFYLMGLEEMGSDPAEAESWLSLAAGQGSAEAKELLKQAQEAKKAEVEYRKWLEMNRAYWYGFWQSGYSYYGSWQTSSWYFR